MVGLKKYLTKLCGLAKKNSFKEIHFPFTLAALLCALLIYTGIIPVRERNPFCSPVPLNEIDSICGTVCTNPSRNSTGKFYYVKLDVESLKAGQLIENGKKDITLHFETSGKISLMIPSSEVESLYPGKLYSLAGKKNLVEQGEKIFCKGKWNNKTGSFCVSSIEYMGGESSLKGNIMHFRAICRLVFKRLLYAWGSAGGLILSLLSGSREYTEEGLGISFSRAGLSHILALSGMHLSFFSGFSGGLTQFLGKKTASLFRVIIILIFVWFAGLSPSLFRALVCSLLVMVSSFFHCKQINMIEILSVSFIIHAFSFPSDLLSAAFMLSYGALLGILLFSPVANKILSKKIPPFISSPLCTSTGAQIITSPICAFLFKTITPIGIISSAAVSPLVSIFMALSLTAILLCLAIPFLSPFFGCILNLFYDIMTYIVKFFAKVPPFYVS